MQQQDVIQENPSRFSFRWGWLANQRLASLIQPDEQVDRTTLILHGATIYFVSFAIMLIVIFATPAFFSTDDYYHMRASEEIVNQGQFRLDFPWLPLTIMAPDRVVNHHLLFHVLMSVPVYFLNMTGAKLVTAAIAAANPLMVWILLRGLNVKYPTIWTMAYFGVSWQLIFRHLMIRVPGGGLLMSLLVLHALFQKKYRWLVPICFLFTWLYSSGVFVLLVSFIAIYMVSLYITEKKVDFRPAIYAGLGVMLGYIINPFFPNNVLFIFDNILPKVNLDASVPVGTEWYPMTTRQLLLNAAGSLVAFAAGAIRPFFSDRKRDVAETTLIFISVMTLGMAMNSLRFMEYFPAFPMLFVAISWGRGRITVFENWDWFQRWGPRLAPFALILIMLPFVTYVVPRAYSSAKTVEPIAQYEGAGVWLRENTPPGSMVFTVGFNDFSKLFFFNKQNNYVIGQDPTYLQLPHPELWDSYFIITRGRTDNIADRIERDFGAAYAVSARRHGAFNEKSQADPRMKLVYSDQFTAVWEIQQMQVTQSLQLPEPEENAE